MKKTSPTPPKLLLRFFRWFCHPDLHPFVEGDLLELYEERLKNSGKRKADRRFVIDVLLLFRPSIIRPAVGFRIFNNYAMFRNYLKVGIRNLLKYKTFSFINIFGLAVAMSVCLLIILMLADQKSYDRFHENKDRVYRIITQPANHTRPYATGPFPLAASLKSDYPIIQEATSLLRGFGGDAVYNKNFAEIRGYFTDPGFFKIFSYELQLGDRHTALEKPNTMVVTHKVAQQLFGNEDPIGKTIDFSDRGIDFFTDEGRSPVDWGNYTITGVLADKDYKTHLEFDVLVSSSSLEMLYKENKIVDLSDNWFNHFRCYTYVLLDNQGREDDLKVNLDHLAEIKFSKDDNLKGSELIPQPLVKITPGPALGNAPSTRLPAFAYYILSLLALVIMVSACLNYSNLSIARAVTRSKEIGVRKVSGAGRKDIIFQFLSESIIIALLALVLANILLIFVKSAFLGLWINKYLNFDLSVNAYVYLVFLGFALLIGFIVGIFPALHLSNYKPVKALKSLEGLGVGRLGIRKVLTVVQFVISLLFIVTSIMIYKQFKHFMQYDYGFDPQHVVNINLQSNDFQLVKNTLSSVPGVSQISGCAYFPATGRNDNTSLKKPGTEEAKSAIDLRVDENFIDVLGINLIAGRNLPPAGEGSDSFILVSEETAKTFGYDNPGDIVGESFEERGDRILQVVGVVEDFTFFLLFSARPTGPIVFRNEPARFNYASVKIGSTDKKEVIARLEEKWKAVDPIHPLNYEFYEDKLANNNQGIFDLVSIIGFIAFLAITIACLGLLGMAIYTMERRIKEVGIRKVLGADDLRLAFLLSKEFLIMLAISILIAAPLSYFLNNLWLNFLIARVEFGFGTVLFGSLLLLILGLLVIGPQTLRVSNRNPIDSLRTE